MKRKDIFIERDEVEKEKWTYEIDRRGKKRRKKKRETKEVFF